MKVMSEYPISITIKLFAAYQDAYGLSQLQREFPSETTVKDVLEELLQEKPELKAWRELTRFGVNLQFVPGDTLLKTGDEVVLIPPVSGG